MKVLQLTVHFSPNIGGVETHLDDLAKALVKRRWSITVLTYRPLTTKTEKWKIIEKGNPFIIRLPWIPNFFYKFVHFPVLEFIYLLPGLLLVAPIILYLRNPHVIHAHGLIAGFVGLFWGKIFRKRVVLSTHSIYHFPKTGLYKNFIKWIFNNADFCLGLSKQAAEEIISLGVSAKKVAKFTYWIDLNKFKKIKNAKKVLGWEDKFIVLFVGRLVEEKGILKLLESVKAWDKNIDLKIIGGGPLEEEVRKAELKYGNMQFLGLIDQNQLPLYYSGSDILIVPSTSEEGFGRVILESLACGTPVIGSNRGAIPEAMDESVGKLIDVNAENLKDAVLYYYDHKNKLKELAKHCRMFAERRYSEKNVEKIAGYYQA